jgi:ribose 5-phosphate isomerase B
VVGGVEMKIGIGSDHAGFKYKEKIKELLAQKGHSVKDFGTYSEESVDYPLFIQPVARAIQNGDVERGIVLGGSGNGEAIAANRFKGVRCALCWNEDTAKYSRKHNNSNCLSLGQRMIDLNLALRIVDIWFKTEFEGGRHERRIKQIDSNL